MKFMLAIGHLETESCTNKSKSCSSSQYYKLDYMNILHTVEGSLSQNDSRHMLQASSQASWIPPSTKAAADVKWLSGILLLSSIWEREKKPFRHDVEVQRIRWTAASFSSQQTGKDKILQAIIHKDQTDHLQNQQAEKLTKFDHCSTLNTQNKKIHFLFFSCPIFSFKNAFL